MKDIKPELLISLEKQLNHKLMAELNLKLYWKLRNKLSDELTNHINLYGDLWMVMNDQLKLEE